jgi:hypothetical protein
MVVRMFKVVVIGYVLFVFASSNALGQDGAKTERPDIRVGDTWVFERTERGSGAKTEISQKVLAVGTEDLMIASSDGPTASEQKWTRDLNYVSGDGKRSWKPSSQSLSFPLTVGRQWKVDAKGVTAAGRDIALEGVCKVSAFEKLTVKAGTFDAFKVECDMEFHVYGPGTRGTSRYVFWYGPATKFLVRSELLSRDRLSVFSDWTQELISTTVK